MSSKDDDEIITIVPSPRLSPTEYVRGVPAEGISMRRTDAQPLLTAGLVTIKPKPVATKEV